jgi:hypothetical protein
VVFQTTAETMCASICIFGMEKIFPTGGGESGAASILVT